MDHGIVGNPENGKTSPRKVKAGKCHHSLGWRVNSRRWFSSVHSMRAGPERGFLAKLGPQRERLLNGTYNPRRDSAATHSKKPHKTFFFFFF